ncbi:MAG: exodeoxyribonuclease VII large subunit, partial [Bacilli bacterium]|nr:exodeoxyribonuclease VII large subunit [Bacilli bacterium]
MERKYITVTALNRYLKYRFDNDKNLQDILLKAEISNFKRHSRGHLYFTLKDETSQISAIMFQSNAVKLAFDPKDGSKVIVEGNVSVYEPSGNYQVYVEKMSEDGIGDLYQAFEKLKARLQAEGMFAEERKRPLPRFPKSVGVVTSPTGAAFRDIIHIINRRYPLASIILYPALVQGEEAKNSLVEQINKANTDKLVDVLIVGRGGGSIEDLWAF